MTSLRSAEALVQSSRKLESMNESEDVQSIAAQIKLTKDNLQVLGDLPQFAHTKQQLLALQERLGDMARPLVSRALSQRDAGQITFLVDLFHQMEREEELQQQIMSFYATKVSQYWKEFTESIQEGSRTFGQCLGEFYIRVGDLLEKEVRWAQASMGGDFPLTSKMVQRASLEVDESYQSFLERRVDAADRCSQHLLDIWKVAAQFGDRVLEIVAGESVDQLLSAVFLPFAPFQENFERVISKRLLHEFQQSIIVVSISCVPSDGSLTLSKTPKAFSDTVSMVEERIPRLFHLSEEGVGECLAFTGGVEAEGFISALSVR